MFGTAIRRKALMAMLALATGGGFVGGLPADTAEAGGLCPDPAPTAIRLDKDSHYGYVVRGAVTNVGRDPYRSGAGQQLALLYVNSTLVSWQDFTSLAAGERMTVEWIPSMLIARGTRLTLMVTYDPDILDDGNLYNDDCRTGSANTLARTV